MVLARPAVGGRLVGVSSQTAGGCWVRTAVSQLTFLSHIDVSLPLSLSHFLSLKINKKHILRGGLKKKERDTA